MIAFALSVLVIFPSVAHGEVAPIFDADAGWTTPVEAQTPGNMAALFIDNSHLSRPGVSYLVHSGLNPGASSVDPTCASTTDTKCNFSSYSFLATIPTCVSAADVNCLSEVGAIDTNGKATVGSFSRYLPDKAQNEYVGNPSWNLPSGTGASLFTIPGVDNPAGNSYLVAVSMGGSGSRVSGNEGIRLNEFSASIVPVQLACLLLIYPPLQTVHEAPILGARRWTLALKLYFGRAISKIMGALLGIAYIKVFIISSEYIPVVLVIAVGLTSSIFAFLQIKIIAKEVHILPITFRYEMYSTPAYAILAAVATAGLAKSTVDILGFSSTSIRVEAFTELAFCFIAYSTVSCILLRFGYIESLQKTLNLLPIKLRNVMYKILILNEHD